MKKITIVWTITLVIIVGGLTFIGFQIKKDNVNNFMEDALKEQAEKYFGLYPGLFPTLGNSKKITYEELKDNDHDPKLESGCTGYVIVENKNSGFDYKAYVSCPNYTTEGYSNE